jgi:hypothetical protein
VEWHVAWETPTSSPFGTPTAHIATTKADTAGAAIARVAPPDAKAFAAQTGTETIGVAADQDTLLRWKRAGGIQ